MRRCSARTRTNPPLTHAKYGLKRVQRVLPAVLGLFDPDRHRHVEVGHAAQYVTTDLRLGPLIGQSPSAKAPSDDGPVSLHCRFGNIASVVCRAALAVDSPVHGSRLPTGYGFPEVDEFVCKRPGSWSLSGATEAGRSPFSGGSKWLEASVDNRFPRNRGLRSSNNLSCHIRWPAPAVRHRS
jgi:hypothetical protein